MAFKLCALSVLAYGNGFTLWHYAAGGDSGQQVANAGYFEDAEDMLTAGDMVMVTAADGGRLLAIGKQAGTVAANPVL